MKSFKTVIALIILLTQISFSFGQKNIAEVNKIQGFYVFVDCQPIAEYEVLGQVNVDDKDPEIKKSGGQYQSIRDNLIKVGRQANFTADGIIIKFVNGGTDKAEIIKFKKGQKNIGKGKVEQYQGVYIFVDSKPVGETEYLGTVKKSIGLRGGQYTVLRAALIKKCKGQFKDAQGLLLKFVEGGADMGDAVKFK